VYLGAAHIVIVEAEPTRRWRAMAAIRIRPTVWIGTVSVPSAKSKLPTPNAAHIHVNEVGFGIIAYAPAARRQSSDVQIR
jgi:hypothetical protein